METVIDAHVHLFDKGYLPRAWYSHVEARWSGQTWPPRDASSLDVEGGLVDPDGTLLLQEFRRAEIDAGICLGLDWGVEFDEPDVSIADVNAHYGALQRKHKGHFFGVAGIDPRRPNAEALFEEALTRHRLRGLKLYPPCGYAPGDPVCSPLYRKCLELDVPVVIHTAFVGFPHNGRYANPLGVGDVQKAHPDLTVVLAHAGHPFWGEQAIQVAANHVRTYLEISNWNSELKVNPDGLTQRILRMRDEVGAHRILFGSDHLGGRRFSGDRAELMEWVTFIRELPDRAKRSGQSMSEEESSLILGENAARVFRLRDARM